MDLKSWQWVNKSCCSYILTHLCCSFSELLFFKVWVISDATTCAKLHPSKQLHATSKYSMLGGCRAAEDKHGRLCLRSTTLWCTLVLLGWACVSELFMNSTALRMYVYICACRLGKTTYCISHTQYLHSINCEKLVLPFWFYTCLHTLSNSWAPQYLGHKTLSAVWGVLAHLAVPVEVKDLC